MTEENTGNEEINKENLAHSNNNIEPSAELTAEMQAEASAAAEVREETKAATEAEKETPPDPIDFEESLKSGAAINTADKARELRRNVTLQDRVDKAYTQPGSLPSPTPGAGSVITRDIGGSSDLYGFVAIFTIAGLFYGSMAATFQSKISTTQKAINASVDAGASSGYYGSLSYTSQEVVPSEYYFLFILAGITMIAALATAFSLIFKAKRSSRITALVAASSAFAYAIASVVSHSSSTLIGSSLSLFSSSGWSEILLTAIVGAIIVLSLFKTDRL